MIRALFQGRPVAGVIAVLCVIAALMAFAAGPHIAAVAAAVAVAPTVTWVLVAVTRRKPRKKGAAE